MQSSTQIQAPTQFDAKTAKALKRVEAARQRNILPSAREYFDFLRPKVLASRPVIGHTVEVFHADGSKTGGQPIYGKPTFRNVIDPTTGALV